MKSAPGRIEPALQCLGLNHGPREAVEQKPAWRIVDGIHEHVDHELVGNQLSPVHVAGGRATERGGFGAMPPEEVAGTEVRQPKLVAQSRRLGAFAGARRPEQDEVHVGHGRFGYLIRSRVAVL